MIEGEYKVEALYRSRGIYPEVFVQGRDRVSEVIITRGNTCVLPRFDIFEILEKGHMSVISIFSWAILLYFVLSILVN